MNQSLLRSNSLKFCSLWSKPWFQFGPENGLYTWKKIVHQLEISLPLFEKKQCCRIKGGLEDELTVESYEADLDRWTPGPGLPGGNRSQHAAVRVQDRLYVSGGLDHDTVLSSLLGMALVSL